MLTLFSIIAIGFILGMRHATDPDHVIAVTTIVSRERSVGRAALIGVLWGLGHTVTIFIVGTAIILFNVVIPNRLGLSMELSVGFMLIVLGIWNLGGFLHSHGDPQHSHMHQPESFSRLDHKLGGTALYQWLRPLAIGIVHGLAGSAAVALLILATIRNSTWAIVYLLVFGLGTIAGMMLITVSIASTFHYVGSRFQRFGQRLAMASGLLSLCFGLFVAYQICVTQGLFSGHPHWTPR